MSTLRETIAILDRLIGFPTVSADSNMDLIAYAADRLEGCGAELSVRQDPSGTKSNLFATLGSGSTGGVLLSGHTDVVPADPDQWTSDPFLLREEGGRLYGRGSCDMKGFLAAVLAMAPHYSRLDLKRPLHIALTYDEEVGCLGARHLVEELRGEGVRPAVAIIGEPTEMRVIEGHKGCHEYTTSFFGTNGHASEPDKGVNAIHVASRFITRLLQLGEELKTQAGRDNGPYSPPWTTVQVGRITGGSARNVIAGKCDVEWEMRPVRAEDGQLVKAALETFCGDVLLPEMKAVHDQADIVTEIIGEVEGLAVSPENEARDIALALTGTEQTDVVAFGTEAGLFQGLGTSAVVCGPGSIAQAHQPDEYLEIGQLQACLDMLAGLSRTLERET
jgi:acetylornithine deacetylase